MSKWLSLQPFPAGHHLPYPQHTYTPKVTHVAGYTIYPFFLFCHDLSSLLGNEAKCCAQKMMLGKSKVASYL